MNKHHLLVIDPTAYFGGSKVATANILKLLNRNKTRITILCADRNSWKDTKLKRVRLYQPTWLADKEQGIAYFLRHLFIALNIFLLRCRFGKINTALGASGPGVDLALYLIKPILGFQLVQLIHGPVATSRTIGRCLHAANEVHYLESTKDSLQFALSRVQPNKIKNQSQQMPANFHIMQNGLPEQDWPSACHYDRPVIFWAASLLKWKGLEVLLDALQHINLKFHAKTHICYIRPKETLLPLTDAPITIEGVHWHENPENMDELRSSANIFISTSHHEPFGLSILEAMAAGHCVLIPADNAFWDRTLKNGINCIKYAPNDSNDLADKLIYLNAHIDRIKSIGEAAFKLAGEYRAEINYAGIKNALQGEVTTVKPEQLPQTVKNFRS